MGAIPALDAAVDAHAQRCPPAAHAGAEARLAHVHVEINEEAAEADERWLSRGAKDGPRLTSGAAWCLFPSVPGRRAGGGMMTVTTP